jgi:hypothetical protein
MRHVLFAVLLLGLAEPVSGQGVTGRLADISSGSFLGELRVIISGEDIDPIWTLTDTAGIFRVTGIPPGEYVVRVSGPCWNSDGRSLLIPEGADVVDVGTIQTSRIPLGFRINHSNCRPTLEEDATTREMLALAETDSTWMAFGASYSEPALPTAGDCLLPGEPVVLFGVERPTMSLFDVGASGLATSGDRQIYHGTFLRISCFTGLGEHFSLYVSEQHDAGQPERSIWARFSRRQGEGWVLREVEVQR